MMITDFDLHFTLRKQQNNFITVTRGRPECSETFAATSEPCGRGWLSTRASLHHKLFQMRLLEISFHSW